MANNNEKTIKPAKSKVKKPIKCPRCNKGFQNFGSKLTRHLQKHAGYHPFKCGYCDFMPADKEEMSKHNDTEHSGQKIKMLVSSFTFPYQKRLYDELMKKVKKQNVKPPPVVERCSLCGEKFYTKSEYKKHLDQIHDVILEDDEDDINGTPSKTTPVQPITTKPTPVKPAKVVPVKPAPVQSKTPDKRTPVENSKDESLSATKKDKFKDYSGEIHKCSLCGFTCNDKFVTKMHTIEAHRDSKVTAVIESRSATEGDPILSSVASYKTAQPDAGSSFLDEEFSEVITSVLAYDQEIKELKLEHQKDGISLLELAVRDNFSTKGRKKFDRAEDWICPDCNRQNFRNLPMFLGHLRCHAVYQPYGCKHCVFTSSDRGEIKRHTDTKHPGLNQEPKFVDDATIPKTKYLNSLLAFQKLNIKTNLISIECFYICRICYAFGTFLKSQFMQHQKKCLMYKSKYGDKFESMIKSQDKANDFDDEMDTSQPAENFDLNDSVIGESNQVSNVMQKPFKTCTFCPFKTESPKLLVEHILSAHPRAKPKSSCSLCSLTFNTKASLKQHKCSPDGKKEFTILCNICDDKINVKEIKSHFENHKVGAKLEMAIPCPVCKSSCKWRTIITHITEHVIAFEDQSKRSQETTDSQSQNLVECLVCKKKVPFDSLQSHLLLHSNPSENKSRSSQCKPNTKFKSYREIYPPESPTNFLPFKEEDEPVTSDGVYFCRLCERSIPLCARVSHIQQHKGIFKFRCKYCPYKKVSETSVRNHIRKVHQDKSEELLKMSSDDWMLTDVIIQNCIQQHLSDVKLPTKWQCVFCQDEFLSCSELSKHSVKHNLQLTEVKRCLICHQCFEGQPAEKSCTDSKEHVLKENKLLYPVTGRLDNDALKFESAFISDEINISDMESSTVELKNLFV